MRINTKILFALTIFATPTIAETKISIGAGVLTTPEYKGSDEYETKVLPLVRVNWTPEISAQNSLSLHSLSLTPQDGLQAEILQNNFTTYKLSTKIGLNYNFGRDEDDSNNLNGLGDIDGYTTATLAMDLEPKEQPYTTYTTVHAKIESDLTSNNNGTTAELSAHLNHPLSKQLTLTHGPSIVWGSKDHTQTYFGISSDQSARSSYSAYTTNSGLQEAGYKARAMYRLSQNTSLIGAAKYDHLLGDAADSPITQEKSQFSTLIGLNYTF